MLGAGRDEGDRELGADVPPGNHYEVIMTVPNSGMWALHCHVLSHAEAPSGFFGLVMVVVAS